MNMTIPVMYQPIGKGPINVLKVDLAVYHTNQNVKKSESSNQNIKEKVQVKVKVNVLVTYYSIGNISLHWHGSNYRNKGGSSNICHLAPLLGVAIEKG